MEPREISAFVQSNPSLGAYVARTLHGAGLLEPVCPEWARALEWLRAEEAAHALAEWQEYCDMLVDGLRACWRGWRGWENDTARIHVWILDDTGQSDEDVLETLYGMGWEVYGREIHSPYDCTGQWFAAPARVTREHGRIFVRQTWHQDI